MQSILRPYEYFIFARYHLPYGIAASVDESCHLSFTSTVLEGSEDLRTHLNTYASVSGGGWGVEFSASVEYDKETETFRDSLSKKIESTAICQYYTTLMGLHSKPTFSKEFNTSLDKMNGEMIKNSGKISENTIFQLIDEFGTHYVESMVLGARFTHVHTMSSELYDSMKSQGIDVEVTAEYSGIISAGASAKMSDSQRKAVSKFDEEVKTKTSTMGKLPPADGNVNTWASETAERPSPIKYELKPITEVFDPSIFPGIKNHLSESYAAEIRQQIDRSKHAYCVHKKSQKKFKHLYCSESEIPDEVLPPPVTCKKVYSGLWWPGKA